MKRGLCIVRILQQIIRPRRRPSVDRALGIAVTVVPFTVCGVLINELIAGFEVLLSVLAEKSR